MEANDRTLLYLILSLNRNSGKAGTHSAELCKHADGSLMLLVLRWHLRHLPVVVEVDPDLAQYI